MAKAYIRRISVPIYNVDVFVIVSENAAALRSSKRWVALFGEAPEGEWNALCSSGGPNGEIALFFKPEHLLSGLVAHEVFHATHRIMEWKGEPFDETKHEQGASLHEFLMGRVTYCLNRCPVGRD